MIWLLSAAAFSFGFGQLFKYSQRRGCHAPTVVAVNYLVLAAVLAGGLTAWQAAGNGGPGAASAPHTADVLRVGGAMGVAFTLAMLVMTRALERAPVGLVLTAFRLAILVPVAVSVWLWDESLSALQAAGIGLALVALTLMTTSRPARSTAGAAATAGPVGVAALLTALGVFGAQGLGQVCLRWVHYAGLDDQRLVVLMVCALTAGLLGALFVAAQRYRPRSLDLRMGAGIGLYNLACLATVLTALSRLDGTLFFPVTGCLVVLMDGVCAHFVWRERLTRTGVAGAGLAALSMLLVL